MYENGKTFLDIFFTLSHLLNDDDDDDDGDDDDIVVGDRIFSYKILYLYIQKGEGCMSVSRVYLESCQKYFHRSVFQRM
jgi:hypothetical protein